MIVAFRVRLPTLGSTYLRNARTAFNAEEEIVAGTTGGQGAERSGRAASPRSSGQAVFGSPGSSGQPVFGSPPGGKAASAPAAVGLPELPASPAAQGQERPAFAMYLAEARRLAAAWAVDLSLRPASVCGISMAITLSAAAWFTGGGGADSRNGAVALLAGYLVAAAGRALAGQRVQAGKAARAKTLPARGRVLDGAPDWLATVGWGLPECAVYAGLAVGATAGGLVSVWPAAIALIGLIAAREVIGACTTDHGDREDTWGIAGSALSIVQRMPAGARVLLIGVVAPVWGPRAALLTLLDWAVIAVIFSVAVQARRAEPVPSVVLGLRDDGALARRAGKLVRGNLLPLPPAVLGFAAVCTLAVLGLRNLPGVLVVGPALVMLLAAPGSSSDHARRLDWLVPMLLLGAQVVYIASLGSAVGVPGPVTFALCAALLLRYADLASPDRPVWLARRRRQGRPAAERGAWLGWEGRLLLVGLGAAAGIGTLAYAALAAYLGVLVGAKIVTGGAAFWKENGSDRRGAGGRG